MTKKLTKGWKWDRTAAESDEVVVDGFDTNKPLLLMDVDGVLNALTGRRTPVGFSEHQIGGFTMRFDDDIRAMVQTLAKWFEIVWFTTWNQDAAPLIGPHVGLEEAGYIETSSEQGRQIMQAEGWGEDEILARYYPKTPLLAGALPVDRPWVWIDDQHDDLDHGYLTRDFSTDQYRLVSTDPVVGMTWQHVAETVRIARRFASDERDRAERVQHEPVCPNCESPAKPIVYGFPGPGLMAAAKNDEVVLGGCCLPEYPPPNFFCTRCDEEFRR